MSDHIIKAAREADPGFDGGSDADGTMTDSIVGIEAVKRFYAIAFAAGMERAAEIADESLTWALRGDEISERILAEAHAQNPPEQKEFAAK